MDNNAHCIKSMLFNIRHVCVNLNDMATVMLPKPGKKKNSQTNTEVRYIYNIWYIYINQTIDNKMRKIAAIHRRCTFLRKKEFEKKMNGIYRIAMVFGDL